MFPSFVYYHLDRGVVGWRLDPFLVVGINSAVVMNVMSYYLFMILCAFLRIKVLIDRAKQAGAGQKMFSQKKVFLVSRDILST